MIETSVAQKTAHRPLVMIQRPVTLRHDLEHLAECDDALWINDAIEGDPLRLLNNQVLAEDFLRIDVTELRRRELTRCIPPSRITSIDPRGFELRGGCYIYTYIYMK